MITRSNPARLFSVLGLAVALAMGVFVSASVANAQATLAILHSFTGAATDGNYPLALIQGADSALFGTTEFGGPGDLATIFKMAPDGRGFTVLHSLVASGLIQDPNGTLNGATVFGGTGNLGVVFQLTLRQRQVERKDQVSLNASAKRQVC